LNSREISQLNRIIKVAEKLIARDHADKAAPKRPGGKRLRRTGVELSRFRKMLKMQRKKGVPVGVLARKHGISSAYIYMLD
jgi:hypothetical protein